jgi:hypothetical protein
VLCAALWLCWYMGVPLAGSLYRLRRKAPKPYRPPTIYDRGAADREVSPLEMVPGTGDPMFDELTNPLRAERRFERVMRKARL